MSYAQPGRHPPGHAYAGPAPRLWMPYGVPPPNPYATYPHAVRSTEPPNNDYWDTELKENPLGLENMHIRMELVPKDGNNSTSSSSTARIPSSSSYSRASDYANRKSYPPNASTKASLAPSKSHPNTRVPSPSRPRHHGRESDRDVIVPSARYASHPDVQVSSATLNGGSSTNRAPSAYQRPPSRSYGGRTSVPVEAGDRYSFASTSAAPHVAQMAVRSQTLPGTSLRRLESAAMPDAGVPNTQRIQRSKTLPGEVLATSSRREGTTAVPVPRRSSDRYDHRYSQDDYEESEEEGEEDEESERILASWTNMTLDERPKKHRKQSSSTDRVRNWIDDTQYAEASQHNREYDLNRDEDLDARSKGKLRSRSYHHAPVETSYNSYGSKHVHDVPADSAARYARVRERDGVARRASAPNSSYAPASPYKHERERDTSYTGPGSSIVTEEPEDMHGYYADHQSTRGHSQYPSVRQSPYKGREHERSYQKNMYESGSSSGSSSDDESEDEYNKSPLGRRRGTREKGRNPVGTPHPAPVHQFSDRRDTLRVDGGIDMALVNNGKAHLPSPRSLRQSSRTPSARASYEYVNPERERAYDSGAVTNGHLTTGASSASAAVAARGHGYGTPPITPTRQDQAHRTDTARMPYAPLSRSSASAVTMAATAEPSDPSSRLTYLYRGTNASPSPVSHRTASTQPQPQSYAHSSQHSQSLRSQAPIVQYSAAGYSVGTETKHKKRSPHASRSPSPLPSNQATSSSSAYYAALGQASTTTPSRGQPRSHVYSQSQSHVYASSPAAVVTSASEQDGRLRSSSRAAITGNGYSSASGAAAAAPSASASASAAAAPQAAGTRNVRQGFWNRRGDHLTETGYVVYCPPGRCYPPDLADYPDNKFKDHRGKTVVGKPDAFPELPESIPQRAGRPPERKYDSFITYVLVSSQN